ncbi:hypothetical protein EBZ80_14320 [bacterium]|nr:hypothetical protein [bacterium]
MSQAPPSSFVVDAIVILSSERSEERRILSSKTGFFGLCPQNDGKTGFFGLCPQNDGKTGFFGLRPLE